MFQDEARKERIRDEIQKLEKKPNKSVNEVYYIKSLKEMLNHDFEFEDEDFHEQTPSFQMLGIKSRVFIINLNCQFILLVTTIVLRISLYILKIITKNYIRTVDKEKIEID